MKARDIMTSRPHIVMPDEPVTAAAALMADYDVGVIPVVNNFEDMRLEGVITDRDIVVRHVAPRHGATCLVRDHMTRGHLDVVRPTDHIHDVVGRMKHDQLRRLLVVDRERRLLGIISQADVARFVGPSEPVLVEAMLNQISQPAVQLQRSAAMTL